MKHAILISCAAAAFAVAPAAFAESAPQQPSVETMHAFFGPWTGITPRPEGQQPQNNGPNPTINDRRFPPALLAKLTPRSRAAFLKFKDMAAHIVDKEPPTPDNNCLPFAVPGETVTTGWPMVIQVTPKVVAILMNIDAQVRLVHMNEQHPKNLKPSMHGHSVGHWEGDTLVIDTIGFDPRSQFTDGFIHGPKLHAVERYRLIDGGKTLEKTFTYDDPDALTSPYTWTRTEHRTDEPFQEYLNTQNNQLYQCPTAEHGTDYKPVQ